MTTHGRKHKYIMIGIGSLALILLFQNMTPANFSGRDKGTNFDESRIQIEQKPLALKGRKNPAPRIEGKYNLQYHIYGQVHRSLPAKFRPKADEITAAIIEESEKQGLDPVFTLAVIQTESGFNPNAKGKLGDSGLMLINPKAAKRVAELNDIPWEGKRALFDPVYNIKIGTAYFAMLRSDNEIPRTYLRGYNSHPSQDLNIQVRKITTTNGDKKLHLNNHILNRIYARKVMDNYALMYKSFNKSTTLNSNSRVAASSN